MATSTTVSCGICKCMHVTTCAEYWCSECKEGLCSDCQDCHSSSKATLKHQTISIHDYKKLPAFITNITVSCQEHGMKFTHFCKQHDQICCPGCRTTKHKNCEDHQPLNDVIQNSKRSALMSILEERLAEMLSFFTHGTKDRDQNILRLSTEKQKIKDEVTEIRTQINSHLDNLEKTMIKKLTDNHTKITFDIQTTANKLSKKSNELEELRSNLMSTKEYGSDLQVFFAIRSIDDEVNKAAQDLKLISEDKCFHQVSLTGKIDHKVRDILSLKSFGDIAVETGSTPPFFKTREGITAQTTTVANQVAPKSIRDIQVELTSTLSVPEGGEKNFIQGCTICPNGKIIFADRGNNRLVCLNSENSPDEIVMQFSVDEPFDVAAIDQQTLAVSTGNGIKIIDVNSKKVIEDIKIIQGCYGITCKKDAFLWCESNRGIRKMTQQDRKVSTILDRRLPSWSFLETHGNKVYFTDYEKETVECLTMDGAVEWKFKNISILNDPTCVTVDNNMFVYTTSGKSNNVVVISPDGTKGRKLLSSKDGISSPRGICFDRTRNNLLVANNNGTAFLYHVD